MSHSITDYLQALRIPREEYGYWRRLHNGLRFRLCSLAPCNVPDDATDPAVGKQAARQLADEDRPILAFKAPLVLSRLPVARFSNSAGSL